LAMEARQAAPQSSSLCCATTWYFILDFNT
jgi:hypothetical protein